MDYVRLRRSSAVSSCRPPHGPRPWVSSVLPESIDEPSTVAWQASGGACGGTVEWSDYSAYEIRIIGALVRSADGRGHGIHAVHAGRQASCWNQWPEISWRESQGPSFLGDLPHTWISGEFILAVRGLFAYGRGEDNSLVAAGIDTASAAADRCAEGRRPHRHEEPVLPDAAGGHREPCAFGSMGLRGAEKAGSFRSLSGPFREFELNGQPLTPSQPLHLPAVSL